MNAAHAAYLVAIAVVGVINILPLVGVLSATRIAGAYGVAVDGPDMEILLRHRALLFGIVGGFVLVSLAIPQYRLAALAMAGVSMLGFLALAVSVGSYGAALGRVVTADLVGAGALAVALCLHFLARG